MISILEYIAAIIYSKGVKYDSNRFIVETKDLKVVIYKDFVIISYLAKIFTDFMLMLHTEKLYKIATKVYSEESYLAFKRYYYLRKLKEEEKAKYKLKYDTITCKSYMNPEPKLITTYENKLIPYAVIITNKPYSVIDKKGSLFQIIDENKNLVWVSEFEFMF